MNNRAYYRFVSLIAVVAGSTIAGLALSSVGVTRIFAFVLGGAWLVFGLLARLDARRAQRSAQRYRTPDTAIYQVFPPRTYEADRQYPRIHLRIIEKGPQSRLD